MADAPPKTKAGKQRKVATVMREFGQDKLKSSSGQKVTNPKQAVAIALSESGQSKPPSQRKSSRSNTTSRLANRIDQRLDQRNNRR
jgi:Family of unknown function (DUF6496)